MRGWDDRDTSYVAGCCTMYGLGLMAIGNPWGAAWCLGGIGAHILGRML